MTFFLLRFLYRPGALSRAALSWGDREREEREGRERGGEGELLFLGVGNLDQLDQLE